MTSNGSKKKRRTKHLAETMQVDRVPESSRRQAACVLEVLAGIRTPETAAEALGVSLPTYYNLETRALRGLVHGCTPESPGRKASLEKQVREAHARCTDLEREVQRYRALLRSTQRAAGVLAAEPPKRTTRKKTSRKARKPRVRALRAIEALDVDSSDRMSTAEAPARDAPEASS